MFVDWYSGLLPGPLGGDGAWLRLYYLVQVASQLEMLLTAWCLSADSV